MDLPLVTTDLTLAEKKAKIKINPKDPSRYPQFYYWPFGKVLEYTSKFPVPKSKERESKCGLSNWDSRYQGYVEWAEPCEKRQGVEYMEKIMQTEMIYRGDGLDFPEVQMQKLFAGPLERAFDERTKTADHRALQEKIFVMKYSLSSYNTRYSEDLDDQSVRVWRLITCFGENTLNTLHDRILGPSMGWTRHFHTYKFVVPTSGACFGPQISGAVDHAETKRSYSLNPDNYQVCHVVREPGQRLIYIYDLGDAWVHNIEVVQIAEKGDVLELPSDVQVRADLLKRYGSKLPQLSGVQLLAGELNCPPEDSMGCNTGRYGEILKEGEEYISDKAARASNWSEHGIRNAYEFDFASHVERLSCAIAGKSSVKKGQKMCLIKLPFMDSHGAHAWNFQQRPGPGEVMKERFLQENERGSSILVELVKTRPDSKTEAVCGNCGRQPSVDLGAAPLSRCASCKSARYCVATCQKSHWKIHQRNCLKMKKERLAYMEKSDKENVC